jgi:DNA-binding transcriptional MerR regulator
MRTIDLARAVGLGVQMVRNYEELGFIPPAERSAANYRQYTDAHLESLRLTRRLIDGYGWQPALDVMRAVHANDEPQLFALVNARHALLDRQLAQLDEAQAAVEQLGREQAGVDLSIAQAARLVGVRSSALRYWEQRGLLDPPRRPPHQHRVYDGSELRRLQVVATLRRVGHGFEQIQRVLDELASGNPDQVRHALRQRRLTLMEQSRRCVAATAAVYEYRRISGS